ncbi:hypothetical protein SLA2020_137290 [Shorea laevis]
MFFLRIIPHELIVQYVTLDVPRISLLNCINGQEPDHSVDRLLHKGSLCGGIECLNYSSTDLAELVGGEESRGRRRYGGPVIDGRRGGRWLVLGGLGIG